MALQGVRDMLNKAHIDQVLSEIDQESLRRFETYFNSMNQTEQLKFLLIIATAGYRLLNRTLEKEKI